MLTVAELTREMGLPLVAGEGAADGAIRWVHSSELSDPTPWLSGGELLLTTGMALTDDATQRAYVDRLAAHGAAGIGLGLGFGHATTPPALREAATAHDLPLFEVPYDTPFIALTERAFTRLVNEGYAVLRRSIAAQERLQRIVLSERGLEALVAALATLVGGAVVVFDARGEPLARRTFRRALDDDAVASLAALLHARARAGETASFAPELDGLAGRALALPVGGGPDRVAQAWLVAVKDAGGLAEADRLLLHQAVTVVALELLRGRVAGQSERRAASDVLARTLGGELRGSELAGWLAPFGVGARVAALVARAGEPEVADALAAQAFGGLVAPAGGLAYALFTAPADDAELAELGERVRARLSDAASEPVAVAVGRAVAAGDARRTLNEARCALEARALDHNGHGGDALGTHRDLGSFSLLLSLQDDDALALFCDSLLGPVQGGEGAYGGELVRSLEAFIEANGQWETAARRLSCHRHTLRYRIRRVEELTGRDLSSARDRIEFWLALRGRSLVGTP